MWRTARKRRAGAGRPKQATAAGKLADLLGVTADIADAQAADRETQPVSINDAGKSSVAEHRPQSAVLLTFQQERLAIKRKLMDDDPGMADEVVERQSWMLTKQRRLEREQATARAEESVASGQCGQLGDSPASSNNISGPIKPTGGLDSLLASGLLKRGSQIKPLEVEPEDLQPGQENNIK